MIYYIKIQQEYMINFGCSAGLYGRTADRGTCRGWRHTAAAWQK